jgi:hypothetical protein
LSTPTDPDERLYLKSAGWTKAEGKETSEGFVVFAGSTAKATVGKAIHPYVVALRDKLVEGGVLHQMSDETHEGGVLNFMSDYLFGSPSTAASVVLGINTNGRTAWKDATGRMLKAIQTAELEESAL